MLAFDFNKKIVIITLCCVPVRWEI